MKTKQDRRDQIWDMCESVKDEREFGRIERRAAAIARTEKETYELEKLVESKRKLFIERCYAAERTRDAAWEEARDPSPGGRRHLARAREAEDDLWRQ